MYRTREESINLLKKAYENKELGFQKGAQFCTYWDSETFSACAIGALMGYGERYKPFTREGAAGAFLGSLELTKEEKYNIYEDFNFDQSVRCLGRIINLEDIFGLKQEELEQIQKRHDALVGHNVCDVEGKEKQFKDYLYSLKA